MSLANKIVLLLIIATVLSCKPDIFIQPTYLKIYLKENSTQDNVLVLDAFPTKNNGLIVFSIRGNKDTKFDNAQEIDIMEILNNGNIAWSKEYSFPKVGFPSNIQETESGYTFFWSDYTSVNRINIKLTDSEPYIDITQTEVDCNLGIYPCGTAYKITETIEKDDFYYLNFRTTTDKISAYVASGNNSGKGIIGQYWTSSKGFFSNSNLHSLAVLYDKYFSLSSFDNTHYLSVPYNNKFCIVELGNSIPIYSDTYYWPFHTEFYDESIAAILVPNFLQNEEGLVYFTPKIGLKDLNQSFSTLNSVLLSNYSTSSNIRILRYNQYFIVAGTSNSGTIQTKILDENANIINEFSFGAGNSYTLSAIRLLSDNKHIALVGYTEVSSKYQRAFVLKIPVAELFNQLD